MTKNIAAILTATVIMISFLAVPLINTVQAASDPTNWYKTVNGVLTTDAYSLYPYNSTSMDIGFSKFGEMIDSNNNVGLQYPGYDSVGTYDQSLGTSRDPFANELVSKVLWVNGWFINIVYRNKIYETGSNQILAYRNVWAFALFSDGQKFGGDWNDNMSLPSLNTGGRQTNKMATTDPMQILYDGPRRFVALLTTHIYDYEGSISWPLVDVLFTIDFQKDKKEVIVYKEVKLKLETKYLDDLVDVQFSNRGEWDLGPVNGTNKIRSYVDFKQEQFGTPYGNDWSVQQDLQVHRNETWIGYGTLQTGINLPNATGGNWWYGFQLSGPTLGNPFVNNTEHVFVNGLYKLPSTPDYAIRMIGSNWWVLFPQQLGASDKTSIAYKTYILGTHPYGQNASWPTDSPGDYAYSLAQLISCDLVTGQGTSGTYVGFEAYWPVLSSFTPDGWGQRLQPLENQQQTDMVNEPQIPFLIGQWDFSLNIGEQFRGVSVLGVTNYHNGQDNNLNSPYNGFLVRDDEVKYQLDEVFNPWNLQSAIEKKTDRYVEFSAKPIGSTSFVTSIYNVPVWVVSPAQWDQYNVFSERVEDLTTGEVLNRYEGDYTFTANSDGTATFGGLISTHSYKFLYSTYTSWSKGNFTIPLVNGAMVNDSQSHLFSVPIDTPWVDPTGVSHILETDGTIDFSFTNKTATPDWATNMWFNYSTPEVEWEQSPFTVFKEDTTTLESGASFASYNATNATSHAVVEFDFPTQVEFNWLITGPRSPLFTNLADVHFSQFCADWTLNIGVFYNATSMNYTVYASVTFAPGESDSGPNVYSYYVPGRYEWVTVGRDASTEDVAGAVDVAAALKDKQVEIGNTATDMMGTTYQTQIPYLLSKTTSGKTPDFQNYWLTPDTSTPGQRQALADDWCTRYPVSSSNIITEGGPLANQVTAYFNEYTSAFYAAPWFTPAALWQGAIAALPCWSKNAYSNTGGVNGTGYATIGTYEDINGTVGLVIYGNDARDTYYVSQFFYQEIIQELQTFPPGVTSIIIKIDYTDAKHPTFTIPEVLGTISERLVESVKGGLHPDP